MSNIVAPISPATSLLGDNSPPAAVISASRRSRNGTVSPIELFAPFPPVSFPLSIWSSGLSTKIVAARPLAQILPGNADVGVGNRRWSSQCHFPENTTAHVVGQVDEQWKPPVIL